MASGVGREFYYREHAKARKRAEQDPALQDHDEGNPPKENMEWFVDPVRVVVAHKHTAADKLNSTLESTIWYLNAKLLDERERAAEPPLDFWTYRLPPDPDYWIYSHYGWNPDGYFDEVRKPVGRGRLMCKYVVLGLIYDKLNGGKRDEAIC